MSIRGLVQVYTGDGRRVNYAPMGLCLRAAGHGFRTYISCFLPHEWMDGAAMAVILLKPCLTIDHSGIERTPPEGDWTDEERALAVRSFEKARAALLGGGYDLVIMHEINRLASQGIIPWEAIMELIEIRPEHTELVLTGPGASEELMDKADLVTEMICRFNRRPEEEARSAPIEVVTGNGKGKTTYSMGKAMLMSCMGVRATILQFIKSPRPYGEIMAIQRLPYLEIKTMGEGFLDIGGREPERKHLDAARRAWEECLREIFSLKYGLIVLDEINIATSYGFVHGERVKEMLFLKPEKLHLILSGRNANLEVSEGADSVIEMREIKHPFHKGIMARKGIEF